MTDSNETKTATLNRRGVLHAIGTAGLIGGFGGVASARGGPSGNGGGGPPDNGGPGRGGPPEKCECPEETFLAKYDFVERDGECFFELAEGEDIIDITGWDDKPGEDCEPITVYYTAEGYRIDQICVFGGRDTDTVEEPDGTFESDLTNPGGQQAAISNLTFCGEMDDDPDPECADLTLEYECTTYAFEDPDNWRKTGTRFRVTNNGDVGTDFGRAVTNDVNTFGPVGSRTIGAETDRSLISDSSVPMRAIVFWEGDPACAEFRDLETWAAFKVRKGYDTLADFYDGPPPANAPADLNDDYFVAEALNIPEESEPDSDIPDDQYPDMSEAAEAAGWRTCASVDQ